VQSQLTDGLASVPLMTVPLASLLRIAWPSNVCVPGVEQVSVPPPAGQADPHTSPQVSPEEPTVE
jgi:hypothetical protein